MLDLDHQRISNFLEFWMFEFLERVSVCLSAHFPPGSSVLCEICTFIVFINTIYVPGAYIEVAVEYLRVSGPRS